ncbi:MAG: epoxyqueuosine reductase QueH [Nitrospirae bacterium]|nr:epoxyqueuosine reductase QueH [Nitrospirota bacterium]
MNILLHICCSNCAIYPVRSLRSEKHALTGFWFNPNIHPYEEYNLRLASLKRLAGEWKFDVHYSDNYSPEEYFQLFNISDEVVIDCNGPTGLKAPQSPERCRSCYQLRLERTAEHAQKEGFDAFSTTLLISPYQDFEQIVATGKELADKYNVQFHLRDYRPYFREAMAYAKELGLYRQKYCGCVFSREERTTRKKSNIKVQSYK